VARRLFGRRPNAIRATPGESVFDTFNVLLMLLVSFLFIYPFWYILVYAFNNSQDAQAGNLWFWPRKITLNNFAYVLSGPLLRRAYLVTIGRAVSGSVLHLVVTGLAAYALSKRYLPGRKVLTYFLIIPMFIGGTMISNYVVIAKLKLLNNFLVYILPWAFSFYIMAIARAFIEEIPASLEESAKMDGAGYLRIFFQLVLPLCTPIIATILIFSVVGHWLDFYMNLVYVTKQELYVLQYVLFRLTSGMGDATIGTMLGQLASGMAMKSPEKFTTETLRLTTLVVVTVPVLFVYPFFQKYIIKGVLLGAIKE
jgi:putative aldouronate transport system permease protein